MKKERIIPIFKLLFLFFCFYYSSLLQLIPIYLFHLDIKHINGTMSVALSTFSSLVFAIFLFFFYRKDLKKEWKTFKDNFFKNIDIGIKYWLCGLLTMMVFNLILIYLFHSGQANNEKAVQSMISSFPLLMVFAAGILAPFVEELVFRKSFKDALSKPIVFILCSGFVFGLMHVINNCSNFLDFLFILPYASLGVSFACMYVKTDTVFTSISMHMLHNLSLVLLSIF